jgi:hypothetical protein
MAISVLPLIPWCDFGPLLSGILRQFCLELGPTDGKPAVTARAAGKNGVKRTRLHFPNEAAQLDFLLYFFALLAHVLPEPIFLVELPEDAAQPEEKPENQAETPAQMTDEAGAV